VSAEIVNLRQFKKTQARSEKDKQAEQNRVSFGRTKAEKTHSEGRIEKDGGEER